MRKYLGIGAALLTSCTTTLAPTPVHGVTPGHRCEAEAGAGFVGQAATAESGRAIVQATKAAVLRWAPPGVMLTMDYREDRVTVRTEPGGKITAVTCG